MAPDQRSCFQVGIKKPWPSNGAVPDSKCLGGGALNSNVDIISQNQHAILARMCIQGESIRGREND